MSHFQLVMSQKQLSVTLCYITVTFIMSHSFESDVSRLEVDFLTNFKKMKCHTT